MSHVVSVPELLDGHAVLDIKCLDRVYLNGYVSLSSSGRAGHRFLHSHLGKIASPAALEHPSPRCSPSATTSSRLSWPGPQPPDGRRPKIWTAIDRGYDILRIDMQTLFRHVGIETRPAAA